MMALDSCEPSDYPAVEAGNQTWVCPNTTQAFTGSIRPRQRPRALSMSLRSLWSWVKTSTSEPAPNTNSPVVGILTNELVTFDQPTATCLYQQSADQRPGALKGWTPVVLPNDVQGYVHNRYTYAPLSPRGVFENVSGQWQIVRVLAGD
ncbi:MAG: hypothetical protein HC886_19570 [Leptolyngbyaceae cyanobacterium SM1_1_3]|nr:hypothetical protein [Leptolyngbyaceae cyanobacterium SM1_1_3]